MICAASDDMQKIAVKPLSVNDAWKGRRFKTDNYKAYERAVLLSLPRKLTIPEGLLCLRLEFGFSSKSSDWDNPVKPFQDILQKKYNFDDNRIKLAVVVINNSVKKGDEYTKFAIDSLSEVIA